MKNVIATLLIGVSIGLFYMFIGPTYSEIQSKRAEKAQYDDALNNSQEILALRDSLLSKYNSFLPGDLARLEKLLPDQINNVHLIIEIDSIASRYGMVIKDVRLVSNETENSSEQQVLEVQTSPFGLASLSFRVTGSYDDYRAFVQDLEKSLRLIDITSVSFSSEKETDVYDVETSFNTYWLKQQ